MASWFTRPGYCQDDEGRCELSFEVPVLGFLKITDFIALLDHWPLIVASRDSSHNPSYLPASTNSWCWCAREGKG